MNRENTRRQFLKQAASATGVAAAFAFNDRRVRANDGAGWKAGLAKAVITPEKAVWLAGYGTKRVPDGKLHDLWMKALALEDADGRRVVLITSDFQGVPKSMSDRVFAQLQQKYGLGREQVMFTFSHNHCGPRLGDDLVDYYPIEQPQVELVDEYTSLMVTKAVALVGEALAQLAPARLQMGEGRATFAVNRRNNPEAQVPAMLAQGVPLAGPVDHTVPVLTARWPRSSSATRVIPRHSVSLPGAAIIPASRSSSWSRRIPASWPCSSTPAAAIRTRCHDVRLNSASVTATCSPSRWKKS